MSVVNNTTSMVFFGTPNFAAPTLKILAQEYKIVWCVTKPDKKQGRGLKKHETIIKQTAKKLNIKIVQPETLNLSKEEGQKFYEFFKKENPDLAVVVAYGKLIPPDLLRLPLYGFINIHPSLLPNWRGADPIRAPILAGEKKTGVTIIKLDEGLDTGDILGQQEIEIVPGETFGTLHNKLKFMAADLISRILPLYLKNQIKPIPQDSLLATYCSVVRSKDALINWRKSLSEIERQIRAYSPAPGAYSHCAGKRVKILEAELKNFKTLLIKKVQVEGKKPIPYSDFLNGYPQCNFLS